MFDSAVRIRVSDLAHMFNHPLGMICLSLLALCQLLHAATDLFPAASAMANQEPGLQRLLLSSVDEGSIQNTSAWKMHGAQASAAGALKAKVGSVAMRFSGEAEIAGAKGDFGLTGEIPGEVRFLGIWVHLEENSNVRQVGFQVADSEDERLMAVREISGTGWQWVELDLKAAGFRQAYPQPMKDHAVGFPLKELSFVWFAAEAGPTSMAVDGLMAASKIEAPVPPFEMRALGTSWGEPGRPYAGFLFVTNFTPEPLELEVGFVLRSNPALEDGASDSLHAGSKVDEQTVTVRVAPHGIVTADLQSSALLGPDAYRVELRAEGAEPAVSDYFVMPGELALRPESRFGINASEADLIPLNKRLGVGWIRFENMKWQFYNPAPGDFRFDGSVGPWHVPHDGVFKRYTEAGFSVLPYIFQTPDWATSAPPGTEKNHHSFPPKDLGTYGEAIFQAVARYGSKSTAAGALKSNDGKSGLDLIHTYEIWNEPNLNDPGWGFFVGTMEEYFELYRVGVEALKRADPEARATSAGYAGISMDIVDQMRTYQYDDGRTPIDFTDILNVHFYTGRQDPEVATRDPNAIRQGSVEGSQTLEEDLRDLADWRDDLKPDMPIWITETGYDVGGPMGKSERDQAAKLPRALIIALANGIEKVFVYRENGSTPAQHAGAGMIRNDGTLRPAYFTYATLIRQFDGVAENRIPRLRTPDPDVWMYQFERNGGKVLVAWTTGEKADLGLDLCKCQVTGAFGGLTEQEVGPGFQLSMFPVYINSMEHPDALQPWVDAASEAEKARLAKRVLQSAAKVYAYDFGSRDEIGIRSHGTPRPFIPVLAEDRFDPGNGYGFVTEAVGDESAHWIPSKLEKDAVRVKPDTIFRILADPGTYRLEIRAEGEGGNTSLSVKGGEGGEKTFKLEAKNEKNPVLAMEMIVTGNRPIELQTDGWGRLLWLALIEQTPGS